MNMILIGPPGAGKGTQAISLAKKYNLCYVVASSLLKDEINTGSILGQEIKQTIDSGNLVKDEIIIRLISNLLNQNSSASYNGYLLDGFPRTIAQANSLDEIELKVHFVIQIEVEDQIIIDRLSGRRVHLPSGRVYHIKHNPPKIDGLDDITHEELTQRVDDKAEVILHRLSVYHSMTTTLIDFYKNKNNTHFIKIDGAKSINDVFIDITTQIDKLLIQ